MRYKKRTGFYSLRFLPLLVLLLLCNGGTLFGGPSTPISTILADANSYHLRSVVLEGIVQQVQAIPPFLGNDDCGPFYDSYTFVLEDTTGSILVIVRGACLKPRQLRPVSAGDHVSIQAQIHAFVPDGSDRMIVKAMANHIQHLNTE